MKNTVIYNHKKLSAAMIDLCNEGLITICKLKREIERMNNIQIHNRVQEFMMIDKLLQKISGLPDPKEHIFMCHQIMKSIAQELEPYHEQIFTERPELKKIFTYMINHGK